MTVSRRGGVAPFHTMRIFEAAASRRAAGLPVFDLSAGQPGAGAPGPVRAAAGAALTTERLGYTGSLGLPALRQAVAEHYARWYGLSLDPASVAITTGSSGGFLAAFLAAFDAGDRVVVPVPGYPAYRNLLASLGCEVVALPCGAESGYQLSVADLEALPERPAGLVLASPANPTGTMLEAGRLAEIAGWCAATGVRLISDEIYHGLTYAGRGECAWEFSRNAIVANSFSKYFCMTGWRLGWLLMPDELRDAIDGVAGNAALCPPTLSQVAALAAFDSYGELDAHVATYRANRAVLVAGLADIGITDAAPPDGAFYVYADVSRFTSDSLAFAAHCLDGCGVALAPGVDFDPTGGNSFVRLCFAGEPTTIAEAVAALGQFLC